MTSPRADVVRPLLLNTMDVEGGAAIATRRIHLALRGLGVDSTLMVQRRRGSDPGVTGPSGPVQQALAWPRRALDQLPVRLYRHRDHQLFSPAIVPDSLPRRVRSHSPDIVHLFWVTGGFVRIESIAALRRPVVWTMHDMWPFTGGCHYDAGCGKYAEDCGACPRLGSARPDDLSRQVWLRKRSAWQDIDLTIVATSHWLAACARESALFSGRRVEVIPNCIDLGAYAPMDQRTARQRFDLPQDRRLILLSAFGATSDARKGFQHLLPALEILASEPGGEDVELVVLGSAPPSQATGVGMRATFIPYLEDEASQVALYSAADVLVAPSVQENLSNTVLESLACGTPVVAFDIGGMPDMVLHRRNGYLARPFEPADLAAGIAWVLASSAHRMDLGARARAGVESKYGYPEVARRYLELYRDVLG